MVELVVDIIKLGEKEKALGLQIGGQTWLSMIVPTMLLFHGIGEMSDGGSPVNVKTAAGVATSTLSMWYHLLGRKDLDIELDFLQRRLHIGYPRAARLMEQLEAVLQKEQDESEVPIDYTEDNDEEIYEE